MLLNLILRKIINKIQRSIPNLYSYFLKKILVTSNQKKLIEELVNKFDAFCINTNGYHSDIFFLKSEKEWLDNINRLKSFIKKSDPLSFLKWDVIKNTMFVSDGPYLKKELSYLKSLDDWKDRWSKSIRESAIGSPTPYLYYLKSSGNLMHHAYHLSQFEGNANISISSLNFVFEFGGGYGSMSRLFHNLGFKGIYIIFDFKEFTALQEYYLKSIGINVLSINSFNNYQKGVLCISDLNILKDILNAFHNNEKSLFLATWSLSETPLKFREMFIPIISNQKYFLISFQSKFNEIDNLLYFEFFKTKFPKISWNMWEIKHLPGNYYLMGALTKYI